jgi:hypothetical protein
MFSELDKDCLKGGPGDSEILDRLVFLQSANDVEKVT